MSHPTLIPSRSENPDQQCVIGVDKAAFDRIVAADQEPRLKRHCRREAALAGFPPELRELATEMLQDHMSP